MSTPATITIKGSDVSIYVHWDGDNLDDLMDSICKGLNNNYYDFRCDDDPEYATFRVVNEILKYDKYDGLGYGLRSSTELEDFNYVIYTDVNKKAAWELIEH